MQFLVKVLNDIGYLTKAIGDLSVEVSDKLKYYTDAAVLYNYVITVWDKKLNIANRLELIQKDEVDNPYQKLTVIQELILSNIGNEKSKVPNVKAAVGNNYIQLFNLRKMFEDKRKVIENKYRTDKTANKPKYEELYIDSSKILFEEIAKEMQGFLAKLYKDSEEEIGLTPPCKYAVIGLGSMALKQMTPYSDLEFAILTENEDYKNNPDQKVNQYFKNLTHLVHFKVINLGETIIPDSKYKVDLSRLVCRAVNFDLGGKTPLGRIDKDKPYDLIKTIDWMLHYVTNEDDKGSHIDKALPYILEKVCYVCGDKNLVQNYQDRVTKFLKRGDEQGRVNHEVRAIKILKEGITEIDYLSTANPKPTNFFKGDLDKLYPNLSDLAGKLLCVKPEIYRLVDRMIYNLGLYYGIEGDSAWDTVDKLWKERIINDTAAKNLKNTVTFAATLRLKTYDYHKAQIEDMSIFAQNPESGFAQIYRIFCLEAEDLTVDGPLFRYFYTTIPLHKMLEKLCDKHNSLSSESRKSFFLKNLFYKDDLTSKGLIYYRISQYKDAQCCLEEALKDKKNQFNEQIRKALGQLYISLGDEKLDDGVQQFKYCVYINKMLYGSKPNVCTVNSLTNLGEAYKAKKDFGKATKYYNLSIVILEELQKGCCEHELHMREFLKKSTQKLREEEIVGIKIEEAYHTMVTNNSKMHIDKLIGLRTLHLKIQENTYQNKVHPSIANSLNNLGMDYLTKEHYHYAIDYFTKSLDVKYQFYKQPHSSIADSLNYLGITYRNQGEYDKALFFNSKAFLTIHTCEKTHIYYEVIKKDLLRTAKIIWKSNQPECSSQYKRTLIENIIKHEQEDSELFKDSSLVLSSYQEFNNSSSILPIDVRLGGQCSPNDGVMALF